MDCIFCKVIAGEIPSLKIWENEYFIAILDINPNTEGVTLVIPKKHYDSKLYDCPIDIQHKIVDSISEVAKLLENKLNVGKVAVIFEGMGINHLHAKLYPLHGVGHEFKPEESEKRVYNETYQGFISSELGPQKSKEDLLITYNKIVN